jgi:hypothetical protein
MVPGAFVLDAVCVWTADGVETVNEDDFDARSVVPNFASDFTV